MLSVRSLPSRDEFGSLQRHIAAVCAASAFTVASSMATQEERRSETESDQTPNFTRSIPDSMTSLLSSARLNALGWEWEFQQTLTAWDTRTLKMLREYSKRVPSSELLRTVDEMRHSSSMPEMREYLNGKLQQIDQSFDLDPMRWYDLWTLDRAFNRYELSLLLEQKNHPALANKRLRHLVPSMDRLIASRLVHLTKEEMSTEMLRLMIYVASESDGFASKRPALFDLREELSACEDLTVDRIYAARKIEAIANFLGIRLLPSQFCDSAYAASESAYIHPIPFKLIQRLSRSTKRHILVPTRPGPEELILSPFLEPMSQLSARVQNIVRTTSVKQQVFSVDLMERLRRHGKTIPAILNSNFLLHTASPDPDLHMSHVSVPFKEYPSGPMLSKLSAPALVCRSILHENESHLLGSNVSRYNSYWGEALRKCYAFYKNFELAKPVAFDEFTTYAAKLDPLYVDETLRCAWIKEGRKAVDALLFPSLFSSLSGWRTRSSSMGKGHTEQCYRTRLTHEGRKAIDEVYRSMNALPPSQKRPLPSTYGALFLHLRDALDKSIFVDPEFTNAPPTSKRYWCDLYVAAKLLAGDIACKFVPMERVNYFDLDLPRVGQLKAAALKEWIEKSCKLAFELKEFDSLYREPLVEEQERYLKTEADKIYIRWKKEFGNQ